MTIADLIAEIFDAVSKYRSGDLTLYQAMTVAIDVMTFVRDQVAPVVGVTKSFSETDLLNLEEAAEMALRDIKETPTPTFASGPTGALPWSLMLQIALQLLVEYLKNRKQS